MVKDVKRKNHNHPRTNPPKTQGSIGAEEKPAGGHALGELARRIMVAE